jgi:thiamine pyrophosphokinase
MKTLIIGESPDFDHEFLVTEAASFDAIYVTDGAIHRVPPEVRVSVVCGDFDSIDLERAKRERPEVEFVHLPDQEMDDVEKALLLAESRGAREVCCVCTVGGRIDRSFANVSTMIRHHDRLSLRAYHRGFWIWVLSGSDGRHGRLRFEGAKGSNVSIIPLIDKARVRAANLKWPLREEYLHAGSRGVSNEALGGTVEIVVSEGTVIVTAIAREERGATPTI